MSGANVGSLVYTFGGCYLMNNCTNDLLVINMTNIGGCISNCSSNGICRNNRCICSNGYYGKKLKFIIVK
jgi:hypothetical protein